MVGTTEAPAEAGVLVMALYFAVALVWLLVRSWRAARRDRAFREYLPR
jgi:hypothetical protein